MQVITAFRSAEAGVPSEVLASPRMCRATCLALPALSVMWRLKLSFLSNHTPGQRSAGWSVSFGAVVMGCIVRLLLTTQGGACWLVFLASLRDSLRFCSVSPNTELLLREKLRVAV
jgi:hypothetical protein